MLFTVQKYLANKHLCKNITIQADSAINDTFCKQQQYLLKYRVYFINARLFDAEYGINLQYLPKNCYVVFFSVN